MPRLERAAPLPEPMQGRWIDADDPTSELLVMGAEVTCFGQVVEYDYKIVTEDQGALTVDLKVNNKADEDSSQRANITGLVITPEGEFYAYSLKFACRFVRP